MRRRLRFANRNDDGKQEGKIEIAQKMKQAGLDLKIIIQVTGLTIDEIEKLSS